MADNNEIILGRRVEKSDNNPKGYTTSNISFDKPTILVLGGVLEKTTKNEHPCGYGKVVQMLLTGDQINFPNDAQIICTQYPDHYYDIHFRTTHLDNMNSNFSFFSEEVRQIVCKQFFPLIENDGVKIPVEQLKRNLRNVNIISHSYGGAVAEQIGNALRKRLYELDYSKDEIVQAMQQVSLLTLGNVNNIEKSDINNTLSTPNFTTLHVFNENDKNVENRSDNLDTLINDYDYGFKYIDERNRQGLFLQPEINTLGLNTTNNLDKVVIKEFKDKHSIGSYVNYHLVIGDENVPEDIIIPSIAAKFLGNVVNNSVTNYKNPEDFVELPNVRELFRETPYQAQQLLRRFNSALAREPGR